jgi:hypothetical protein
MALAAITESTVFAPSKNDDIVELRLLVIDGWEKKNPLPGTQVELIGGQDKLR